MAESIAVSNRAARSRRIWIGIPALAIGALVIFAHIRIAQIGNDYAGGLTILDRLFDLALVSGLGGLAFCAGRALSRRLALDFANAAEEFSISVLLGTGIIGTCVLGFGLAGWLKPLPIIALLALTAALTRREAARLVEMWRAAWSVVSVSKSSRIITGLFLLLIALLALQAATPPTASLEEAHQDLKRQGVTHIIYSPGQFKFVALNGRQGSGPAGTVYYSQPTARGAPAMDYWVQLRNWVTFENYHRKYLEVLFEANSYYVSGAKTS